VSINPGGPNGGSATQYFTGHFDGKTFVSDQKKEEVLWLDYGRDNYAGVTFFNAPEGKRLLIGWMSNWDYAQVVPTHPWRSAMTLPRELKLEKTPNGYRLKQDPVHALKILRGNPYKILQSSLHKKASGAIAFDTPQEFQITLNLKKTNATEWGIKLYSERGDTLTVGYDVVGKRYFSDRTQAGDHAFSPAFATKRHYAPRLTDDPTMECRLFIDRSSVEWFADDGLTVMTELYFARGVFNRMTVYMKGDVFDVEDVESWPLNSVWKE
jgi:fructan beta-fructosidase